MATAVVQVGPTTRPDLSNGRTGRWFVECVGGGPALLYESDTQLTENQISALTVGHRLTVGNPREVKFEGPTGAAVFIYCWSPNGATVALTPAV